ncbi:MAG TPA: hypothetical protein VGD00_08105, partial [Solirubrobacteraceae bacterium]
MAKLTRSFTMSVSSEEAQRMFVRDLVPELHRSDELVMYEERPGRVALSTHARIIDGDVYEVSSEGQPGAGMGRELEPLGRRPRGGDHMTVEFHDDPLGCKVEIDARVLRDMQQAIERLGTPGHWPETANT